MATHVTSATQPLLPARGGGNRNYSGQPGHEHTGDNNNMAKTSCKECCTKEFHPRNFGLSHESPELFATAQGGFGIAYVIYRVIWALFHVTWIILSGVIPYSWYSSEPNRVKWFIYLTNWSYLILTVSAIMQAAVAINHYVERRKHGGVPYPAMTWYLKMAWVIYNISSNAAIVVTALFWGLIFPAYLATGTELHYIDVGTHGGNTLYVLIDIFITATPVRIYHFLHPFLFGATFLVFSAIYDVTNGTNALDKEYIYSVLDWTSNAGSAAMYAVLVALVAIPLVQCVLYGLYRLRTALYGCCCPRSVGPLDNESGDKQEYGMA
ncbi:protein rolling stone [Lingula anatina]|uniref:Protein rolling stone n=1 Tax=Lingula anatina TaxID=7574 RepID=A0A1S3I6I7_LINAN|nr:protein rolling stone [Lingula anatina]|eukprot:XP_013393890.1 protein rolling stone [Lingula anatina]